MWASWQIGETAREAHIPVTEWVTFWYHKHCSKHWILGLGIRQLSKERIAFVLPKTMHQPHFTHDQLHNLPLLCKSLGRLRQDTLE